MKAAQPTTTGVRVCLVLAVGLWAGLLPTHAQADRALENWTLVHSYGVPFAGLPPSPASPTGSPAGLNDIAGGNGVYVAIGSKGGVNEPKLSGVVWRTLHPDRGPWVEQASGTTNELLAVTYGKGEFVAVGASGTITTSKDGTQWTVQSTPTTSRLRAVVATANGFIAVGDGGTVLNSGDGVNWSLSQIAGGSLYGVCFTGQRYLAVGRSPSGGGVILSSTNGRGWGTVHTLRYALQGVACRPGRCVAVGVDSAVATSTNGVNWTDQTLPAPRAGTWDDLLGVAASQDGFVAVTQSWMYTSRDGANWELLTGSEPQKLTSLPEVVEGPSALLSKIRFVEGKWFGVGTIQFAFPDFGYPLLISSTDAYHWRFVSGRTELKAVAYGNGLFVAVGARGTVLTSKDGTDWVEQASGTPFDLNDVKFAGGQFVAVGGWHTILTSPDGRNWKTRILQFSDADAGYAEQLATSLLLKVAFGNGVWVAGGGGLLVSSLDGGRTWTFGEPHGLIGLAFGNGRFLTQAPGGQFGMFESTSTDGVHWQRLGLPPLEPQYAGLSVPGIAGDLAFGGGVFASVSQVLVTTPGGGALTNWTARLVIPKDKRGVPPAGSVTGSVAYVHGRFLALAIGTIWSSTNGTNWIEHDVSPSDVSLLWDATYGAGVYVAVGWDGTILQSAPVEPVLVDPAVKDGAFTVLARVPPGKSATVEFSASLSQPDWKALTTVEGGTSGKSEAVTDPSPPAGVRFYRLREQ